MSKRKDGYASYKDMGKPELQTVQADDKEICIETLGDLDIFLNQSQNQLGVLYVHAKWCGPCKHIGPKYFELWKRIKDKNLVMRKIDGENEICKERGIRKLFNVFPTFLYFKGGKLVETVVGANLEGIADAINKHI